MVYSRYITVSILLKGGGGGGCGGGGGGDDDNNNNNNNNNNHNCTKETEKLGKYRDFEIKVSRMWKVRKFVSVITGALGTIKKLLPGHLLAIELQQITLMSPAHICKVPG